MLAVFQNYKRNIIITCIVAILNLGMWLIPNRGRGLLYYFICSTIVIYFLVRPLELFHPINFVAIYYILWYGIAPLFAKQYQHVFDTDPHCIAAYRMLLMTYSVAVLTLSYTGNRKQSCGLSGQDIISLNKGELLGLFVIYLVALGLYILRTGGLSLWLKNPNEAFFSRGGSGVFYLLFEYAAIFILFFEGKKPGIRRKVCLFGLCFITMYFCGSKSIMILLLCMLFSNQVIKRKLINRANVLTVLILVIIFFVNIYLRLGDRIKSQQDMINVSLRYFDTLDNFLVLLRDFHSAYFKTLYFPINWILMKFGVHIGLPYHDTSIWLTNVYYPESWLNGGTRQWPLEAWMYLNFKFFGGIPLVIAYFGTLGMLYKKAKEDSGVWRLICI